MKSIILFGTGLIVALFGAFSNPMNWAQNYKYDMTPMIYVYSLFTVIGIFVMGIACERARIEDNE